MLAQAIQMKEVVLAETVVVCKMLQRCLVFRDFDEAETIARQYLGFFEECDNGSSQFVNIYRYFYGGLIAFHCFRKIQDKYWKALGMQSITKFEKWTKVCVNGIFTTSWCYFGRELLRGKEYISNSFIQDHHFIGNGPPFLSWRGSFLWIGWAGLFYLSIGTAEQSENLLNQSATA